MPENTEYFRARMIAEIESAKEAEDEAVAEIHGELAQRYQALVDQAEGREPTSLAHLDDVDLRPSLGVHWNGMGRAR